MVKVEWGFAYLTIYTRVWPLPFCRQAIHAQANVAAAQT